MNNDSLRMIDSKSLPSLDDVKAWIGTKSFVFWDDITQMIDRKYKGIFLPEWLYGGKKHGWVLRYKKSKSFCTLIPEKGCLKIVIVFGVEERKKVDEVRSNLSVFVQKQYDDTVTYHDGKWLLLTVDSKEIIKNIEILLALKRKPKDNI
ncbi:MAG: DUF3788 domain-containing protein [Endomicrobiia bacterium]